MPSSKKVLRILSYCTEYAEKLLMIVYGLLEDAESDEEIAAIKKEYKMWKWTFPMAFTNRTEKDLIEIRKKRLQDGIEELKRQLADLDTLLDSI